MNTWERKSQNVSSGVSFNLYLLYTGMFAVMSSIVLKFTGVCRLLYVMTCVISHVDICLQVAVYTISPECLEKVLPRNLIRQVMKQITVKATKGNAINILGESMRRQLNNKPNHIDNHIDNNFSFRGHS